MRSNLLSIIFGLLTFGLGASVNGQSFVNLDFEDTILPPPADPNQAEFVSFASAFPGWTGYAGSSQANQAIYNGVSLETALASLISSQTGTLNQSNNVIGGNFTAVIRSGYNSTLTLVIPMALAQTGQIPDGTKSLLFNLGSFSTLAGLTVTFDGQSLNLVPLFAAQNYETYGADISAYAGMTGELRFTEGPTGTQLFNYGYLDDIQFSSSPVPEPSEFALFTLGAMLFGFRRWQMAAR